MKRFLILLFLVTCTFTASAAEPLIVAHRGLLRFAPENTLANFRACLELRLGFEFDVQRTKDGKLVCIHDSTLDRTTNGSGKVSSMTLKQIRRLDAGSWFDRRFSTEKVPTVDEVLQLISRYRQQDVLIAVDLKTQDAGAEVARLATKYKVHKRLFFIGRTITSPAIRAAIRAASGQAQVARLANLPGQYPAAVADKTVQWVYVRFLPSRRQIAAAKAAGKRVFIAGKTVAGNLPKNWRHLSDVGIDGILTDYPLRLKSVLRQQKKTADER